MRVLGKPLVDSMILCEQHPTAYAVGAFLAFLAFFNLANGDGVLPALIAAQRFFTASAIAFRPAALSVRLALAGAAEVGLLTDPGGRPRLFSEPCSASIARDKRSRSAINRETIWSVDITAS